MAPGNLPQSTFQSKNRISSASPVPQAAPKTHSSAFFYPFPQNRRKSASMPHFKTILSEGTDTAFFRAVMHNFAPVQKTFSGLCPPLSDLFPYNQISSDRFRSPRMAAFCHERRKSVVFLIAPLHIGSAYRQARPHALFRPSAPRSKEITVWHFSHG